VAFQHDSFCEGDDGGIPVCPALDPPLFAGLPGDRVVRGPLSGWSAAVQISHQLLEGFLYGVLLAGQVKKEAS
jgi:hypothetical protein